jgi:hypothetical protein
MSEFFVFDEIFIDSGSARESPGHLDCEAVAWRLEPIGQIGAERAQSNERNRCYD